MKTQTTSLSITSFTNRNGVVSYRVGGYVRGERIRKNFKSRDDAIAEKNALEIKFEQKNAGLRSLGTFLSEEQLREAEALVLRTKDKPRSLTFYVDYALTNFKEPTSTMKLADALREYFTHRTNDHKRGLISDAQFSTIRKQTERINDFFPDALVSDLNVDRITAYCARADASLKTHNNRRGIISTFLKFAHSKGWIADNPIAKVPHYRIAHKRGTAPTLTVERAAALMEFVEEYRDGCLVPFFALALFAGIRPDYNNGEIAKLTVDAINLATGVIHIEPKVSKVNMKRRTTIQPNLAAWLKAYPLDKYPLVQITNFTHRRSFVAKKFNLSHDVLRHTFVSMHVAKFRSMGDTALQAGNSEEIIRKHYLDVKSPAEADAFFAIMPKKRAADATPAAAMPAESQCLAA